MASAIAPEPSPAKLLRINEACALLGVSRKKLYQLMDAGAISYVQLLRGKQGRRLSLKALEEFIWRNTIEERI